jgi:ketosteroid isomerase-like protein
MPEPYLVPDQSGIEVVRAIYAALAARDFTSLYKLLDPDIVMTQDPDLPWGGRYEGYEGFVNFGLTLTETIDSAVTIEAIFAADDEVIQCGRTRGTVRANGVAFDIPEVHRWRLEDGLAVEAHFAIDTAAMLAAIHGEEEPPA